jgi:glucosyl-dolichyl phosphate glucuronosyltransferase
VDIITPQPSASGTGEDYEADPEKVRDRETVSPSISVIICTYNRCAALEQTQDLVWELLVVDNNSSDQTAETVRSFITNRNSLPLEYVFEPIPGLSSARNCGIRASRGTIVAFIDDDVLVSREWLSEVRNAFQQYDPLCVSGRVLLRENQPRPGWWHRTYDLAMGKFDRGTAEIVYEHSDKRLAGIGANMMFKRISFDRYGLFRVDMGRKPNQLTTGEETEMLERLRRQKERIVYYPKALVYHCPSAERFSKRYLRRHFYCGGQWAFLDELETLNPAAPRLLGVPRWRYRLLVTHLSKAVWLGLQAQPAASFFEQLQVIFFGGYLSAARAAKKHARSS